MDTESINTNKRYFNKRFRRNRSSNLKALHIEHVFPVYAVAQLHKPVFVLQTPPFKQAYWPAALHPNAVPQYVPL